MFDISFPELVVVWCDCAAGSRSGPPARRTANARPLGRSHVSGRSATLKTEIEREIGMDEIRRQLHNEAVMDELKRLERDVRGPSQQWHRATPEVPDTPPSKRPPGQVSTARRTTLRRAPERWQRQLTEKPKRAEEHDKQVDTDERPFLDHIIELRERLLKALLAVLAAVLSAVLLRQQHL